MTGPGGRIVVGLDGSEPSVKSLKWAAEQARLTGAVLDVVTTWEPPAVAYSMGASLPLDYDPAEVARSIAEQTIASAFDAAPGIPITSRVVEGHPATVLVEAAENADLLVLGASGHGAFVGRLLGSVPAYCTQHATCPVVVVRGHTSKQG